MKTGSRPLHEENVYEVAFRHEKKEQMNREEDAILREPYNARAKTKTGEFTRFGLLPLPLHPPSRAQPTHGSISAPIHP